MPEHTSDSEQAKAALGAISEAPECGAQALVESPTQSPLKDAVEAVERFLSTSGPQPGSLIAAYLETQLKFRPRQNGFPSLSEFLRRSFGDRLQVVSSRGTDKVWQLDQFGATAVEISELGARVWRALASPNSLRKVWVYVHTHTGEWSLRDAKPGRPNDLNGQLTLLQPGGWQHVGPMPPSHHARLARRFAKRPDLGVLGTALHAVVSGHPQDWWQTWRYLLADHPVHQQSWLDQRDDEIRRYVSVTLREAGLGEAALAAAMRQIGAGGTRAAVRSEFSVFASRTDGVPSAPMKHVGTPAAGPTIRSYNEELRTLLQEAIAQMPEADLPQVLLPATAFLALSRNRRD